MDRFVNILPKNTLIFCGHEYTEQNLLFLYSIIQSKLQFGIVSEPVSGTPSEVASGTPSEVASGRVSGTTSDTASTADIQSETITETSTGMNKSGIYLTPSEITIIKEIIQKYNIVLKLRQNNIPTIPTTIENECKYNLFMKCRDLGTQRLLAITSPVEIMSYLRNKKNNF